MRSIVGQFLEHSRIYRFGGSTDDVPHPDAAAPGAPPLTLLIGSADLMERNLDRRIEVLVPVRDPELQARLLEILDLVFADDTNAWVLGPDRRWRRVPTRRGVSSQRRLRSWPWTGPAAAGTSTPAWTAPDRPPQAVAGREGRGRRGRLLGSPGEPAPALPGARGRSAATGRPRRPTGMGSQKLTRR